MKRFIILIVLFFAQFSFGQAPVDYSSIDKIMAAIPDSMTITTKRIASYINSNFTTENQKARAAFIWTASNIAYDVPNMFEPNGVYSSEEKIDMALATHKGVCIHYAEIYNDVANKIGVKTYVIPGYTKQFGQVAPISHAWCVSKVDGKWFVFDPTWSAGFIDNNKFTKKLNNTYYKAEPSKMIGSHMPFDYMWQLLKEPMTNQEFISGKPDLEKPKLNFDFASTIDSYEKLPDSDKAFDCVARIEKNGLLNNLIIDYRDLKKKEFTIRNENKSVDKLNDVGDLFNETVRYLNDFIVFRNNRFRPKQSDETLKGMMKEITDRMNKVKDDVYKVGQVSKDNAAMYSQLKRSVSELSDKVKEQENFLNEYLSKGSLGRKVMFTNLR